MSGERLTPREALLAAVRNAARQEQFLEVIPAEEARRRFEKARSTSRGIRATRSLSLSCSRR